MIIIELKCTINITQLNHPETTPPPMVHGKVVFCETGSWFLVPKRWGTAAGLRLLPQHEWE